jgi:hypothetical protein
VFLIRASYSPTLQTARKCIIVITTVSSWTASWTKWTASTHSHHISWYAIPTLTYVFSFIILVSWGGVRLSPLGTSATNWPIAPGPENRWWVWSSRWNENWQGKPKYSEKTCPSTTLSTTNPTWPDLGSNPGRRGGKSSTNHLSYYTAYACVH